MKEFRNLQFHSKVPDGHPGPVCGYGLQPSILSPRTHIQVNLLSVNGMHRTYFTIFFQEQASPIMAVGFLQSP